MLSFSKGIPIIQQAMNSPLKIEKLTKKYGDFKAVDELSLELKEGEIFGLLGPNGAGKTTLISCIVTLEEQTKGDIRVFGNSTLTLSKVCKSLVGYVPQEVINHGYFTVYEILQFYSGYFGILQNKKRIDYLLERLSLQAHRNKKVKQLSGGMKRRLMIAKALVHKPKLLLLDEPTAGVDIELRNSLWEFVETLKDEGTTVLLTTHYLEEAESLCDRVGVIDHGKLRRVGDTKTLISQLTQRDLELRLTKPIHPLSSPYLVEQDDKLVRFQFPSSLTVGKILSGLDFNWSDVEDIQVREGSLEDAFIRILGEDSNAKI